MQLAPRPHRLPSGGDLLFAIGWVSAEMGAWRYLQEVINRIPQIPAEQGTELTSVRGEVDPEAELAALAPVVADDATNRWRPQHTAVVDATLVCAPAGPTIF